MYQDEVQRNEQEWEAQAVVCPGFCYDDVSDAEWDVFFGETAWCERSIDKTISRSIEEAESEARWLAASIR
jgi:hypothetical protein